MTPPRRRSDSRAELFAALGVKPKDLSYYETALTHRSVLNEAKTQSPSNERLEFLGDSVLGHAVSEFLFDSHPDLNEGQLARRKSSLVSESTLTIWARHLEIGDYLSLGKGEEQTGGREKPAILADAFEALLGAAYLDLGWPAARDLVFRCLKDIPLSKAVQKTQDAKSRLQEYTQRLYKKPPLYKLLGSEGPDHAKRFEVEVVVHGKAVAVGKGKTKKEAEQDGADKALEKLEA